MTRDCCYSNVIKANCLSIDLSTFKLMNELFTPFSSLIVIQTKHSLKYDNWTALA